jgi:hypothetical protein
MARSGLTEPAATSDAVHVNQLVLLVVLSTTIWVGVDASAKDFSRSSFARSTAVWVIGCLALWIVVFPIYLVQRGKVPPKHGARPSPTGHWALPSASPTSQVSSVPPPGRPGAE